MVIPAAVVGWLLIVAVLVIAQQGFYRAHRSAHHEWTLPQQRLGGKWSELLSATIRADSDPGVERARRRYLAVIGLAALYLVIGAPLAIWLDSLVHGRS